jgi:glycerophosphoryl diester phosphodiesterase
MLETLIHEISLAGYKVTSAGGMLDLGTWGSYGIEKLHLTLDAAWQDLTITAFFNVKGEVVAKKVVGKDGYADVPWEATKENTFAGRIVFEGSINGQRRISANLNYKVTNHSEITDSDPVPTDDRWNQFVTENKEYRDGAFEAAERANARAEDAEAASDNAQAAARAAKASENAAKASENAAKASENAAKASENAAKASENAAKASENAAKASENAAASSEDNARISAGAAAASKGNAAASADKAKASETAAAESEKAAAKSAADADSTANSIKDSMTQIAANKEAVSQLKEDLRNENLFVKRRAVRGVRLAANGTIVDGEKNFTSDYIPIERLLNYKKNSPLINYYHRMCVYNTAKNYIKNIDDTNELYNENGAYVRFCGLLTEIDEAKFIQCNAYDSISRLEIKKNNESYASFKEEVFNNTGYYKKSNDYKVTLNSGWAASGVLLDSEIYNAVEISVKDGEKIAFAGSFGENAVCLEVLYDGALKNRIKISGDFNAPNLFYHKVSNGVTKILLSVRNQNNAGYKFKFEYFKNSIFDSTKRILSQAQFIERKFYSTAHQGYIGYGSKENTLQAFIDACESGKFNCIETDARLTKDNIFVLSHDASIVDSGITYVIKEKTYEELKKVFTDICTLEECMKICKKYGVYLLIDKLIYATIEENSQYLFPIIRKYRMQDTVLFSSAVSREGWTKKILEFNPKAKIAFYYPNEWFTAEQLAKAKNYVDGKNEIIITCSNTAITEENLQLFYDNCDGVKIGTSVQNNLELYKSLFYTMDYIDSNEYGVIDCFYN